MLFKTVSIILITAFISIELRAEETLYIAVTSSFTQTLKTLVDEFHKESAEHIKISSASSTKLYAQIHQGANFDLFFSADDKHTYLLEEEGKVTSNTSYNYAIGKLVLWAPNNTKSNNWKDALNEGSVQKIAIANPHYAPYGIAAVEFLKNSDLWERYNSDIIMANNVNQASLYIDSGNVNKGLIALSQLQYKYQSNSQAKNLLYWEIPQQYYNPIVQQVVILKHAENKSLAKRFLQFIKTQKSQAIIQASGYSLPEQ